MKGKFRLKKKVVLGLLLIFVAVGAFGFWELGGREMLLYPKVVVLKTDLDRGSEIRDSNLTVKRMIPASRDAILLKDVSQLKNMVASQWIKAGEPLYPRYFVDKDMITDEGEGKFIFSLSENWLASYPQSLRRGDYAYIYSDGAYITKAKVAFVKDSDNNEVTSDKERLGASGMISAIEIIVDQEQASMISQIAEDGSKLVILYN